MSNSFLEYHQYLLTRSIFGNIYRKFFLYPLISLNCKDSTLDFGCGIGDFLKFRGNTVGVDINPYNVAHCIESGHLSKLLNTTDLPFAVESFDTVLMDNVIEHIDNPTPILIECIRVLKRRGRIIIGVPGQKGFLSDADHVQFYDEASLKQLLVPHGFALTRSFSTPFFVRSTKLGNIFTRYCEYYIFDRLPQYAS